MPKFFASDHLGSKSDHKPAHEIDLSALEQQIRSLSKTVKCAEERNPTPSNSMAVNVLDKLLKTYHFGINNSLESKKQTSPFP